MNLALSIYNNIHVKILAIVPVSIYSQLVLVNAPGNPFIQCVMEFPLMLVNSLLGIRNGLKWCLKYSPPVYLNTIIY